MKDTYRSITTPSPEVLFKDRNSKFYGYAYPIHSEEEAKQHLTHLKKEHHQARHWCYAWVLGKTYDRFRVNDDGEPSHSAGTPIYGQLQSFDVTQILVVVVRYFGGTKLGVSGLINAYRTAAQMALQAATIKEYTIDSLFTITFEYPLLNKVMRLIKEYQPSIINQTMELDCKYTLSIRKSDSKKVMEAFKNIYGVNLKEHTPSLD